MASQPTTNGIPKLPLSALEPDPNQPRKDLGDLTDLMASIGKHGVIQPVIVSQIGENRFRIIAGHRRFEAVRRLGHELIPAIVRTVKSAQDLAAIQLIENLHREDLTPFEVAEAMHELITQHGMKQIELAKELGKSPAAVNQLLRLRAVCEPLRREIHTSEHRVSQSLLLEIAKVANPAEQFRAWRELVEEGKPTVRKANRARRRGAYGKRYDDLIVEDEGLKVMVRWKTGNGHTRDWALVKATELLKKTAQSG